MDWTKPTYYWSEAKSGGGAGLGEECNWMEADKGCDDNARLKCGFEDFKD